MKEERTKKQKTSMLEYRKPEGEKETTIKTKQGEENSQGRRQKTENTVFANQKLKA